MRQIKHPIAHELRHHAPFTAIGAITGIIAMFLFRNLSYGAAHRVFYVLHPMHVFLSALVTAAMYKNYKCKEESSKCGIASLLGVGLIGSIGIATLSDSIIPFWGEKLLGMEHAEVHIGFIEEWWLILPLAVAGVIVAYFWPKTKMPHAGHVLLSTWASLFHMIMAAGGNVQPLEYAAIFAFLFLSVWLPCCVSDIIFPLLFIKGKYIPKCKCCQD